MIRFCQTKCWTEPMSTKVILVLTCNHKFVLSKCPIAIKQRAQPSIPTPFEEAEARAKPVDLFSNLTLLCSYRALNFVLPRPVITRCSWKCWTPCTIMSPTWSQKLCLSVPCPCCWSWASSSWFGTVRAHLPYQVSLCFSSIPKENVPVGPLVHGSKNIFVKRQRANVGRFLETQLR